METASNLNDIDMSEDDEIPRTMPRRQTCKPSRYLPQIPPNNTKHRVTKREPNTKAPATLFIKKQENKSALLMTLLNQDCRFMIFDALIDQETTVQMRPNYQANGLVKALSQTSKGLRDELKAWSQKRPDLQQSAPFGLYNPFLTSFQFCFTSSSLRERGAEEHSKTRRLYHPEAAMKHIDRLELWQRAMQRSKRPCVKPSLESPAIPRLQAITLVIGASMEAFRHKGKEWLDKFGGTKSLWIQACQHAEDGVVDEMIVDSVPRPAVTSCRVELKCTIVGKKEWVSCFDHLL